MPLERDDYDGPILPGSRWRQRGLSGHGYDLVSVLRVNDRSVQVVYEGGGHQAVSGRAGRGTRHKAGRRFGIGIPQFRHQFVLVSQPPRVLVAEVTLVKAEAPKPAPPRSLGDYFQRRRWVSSVMETMEGKDIRRDTADHFSAPPDPRDLLQSGPPQPALAAPAAAAAEEESVLTVPPASEPTEPVLPDEEMPALAPEASVAPVAPEADPLDAFLDGGRALVDDLDRKIAVVGAQHAEASRVVATLEDALRSLTTKRNRIDGAVHAAIAAALEIDEPAPIAPDPPASPSDPEAVVERPAVAGTTRLANKNGYVPQPGKVSQRDWVLTRFAETGRLTVQGVVAEFAEYFGIPRDQAIKNISSLMGYQMKAPNSKWPVPVRTRMGEYAVAREG